MNNRHRPSLKTAERQLIDGINTQMASLETIPTASINPNAFLYYLDPDAPAGANWKKVKVVDVANSGIAGVTNILSNTLDVSGASTKQIDLRVQGITRASFIAAIATTSLKAGLTYSITDPISPLTNLWIKATAGNKYDSQMSGMVGTVHVECGWSTVTNKNTYIYNRQLNNLAIRPATSVTNCIENFDVTNSKIKNCAIVDSNISLNLTNTNVNGLYVEQGCAVTLNKTTITGLKVGAGSSLNIGTVDTYNITRSVFGPGHNSTFNGAAGGTGSMSDSYIDYQSGIALATNNNWNNIHIDIKSSNLSMVLNPDGAGALDFNSNFADGSNVVGVVTPDSAAVPLTQVNGMSLSPNHWRYEIRPSVDGFEIHDQTVGGGNVLYQAGGIIKLNGATGDDIATIWAGSNTNKAVVLDVFIH